MKREEGRIPMDATALDLGRRDRSFPSPRKRRRRSEPVESRLIRYLRELDR
jgi:hypothetical protein